MKIAAGPFEKPTPRVVTLAPHVAAKLHVAIVEALTLAGFQLPRPFPADAAITIDPLSCTVKVEEAPHG